MNPPTFNDISIAREFVGQYLPKTPLVRVEKLSDMLGCDYDEARGEAERVALAEGYRYVHSANEPKLIAGVGVIGLEIFDDLPNVEVIIAPAGGGSCASGNCIVAKHLKPHVRVIAVQSERAPAMWHAWRNRTLAPYPTMETKHEGLATRVP